MTICTNQAAKVWQYNGWNFEESPVQFTGGALAKGVSHLRHYPLSNGTAIGNQIYHHYIYTYYYITVSNTSRGKHEYA